MRHGWTRTDTDKARPRMDTDGHGHGTATDGHGRTRTRQGRGSIISSVRGSRFEVQGFTEMSNESPKSAVELAMERFRKQDVEAGVVDKPLTLAQREAIAEVRRVHEAR